MKIAVCIKQVPTRDWQPRLNEARTWIREQDATYEMNEPDAYALEESLRLKERHGGEVVVCSAGPARVGQVIREALARGADRAIHVDDEGLASADAFAIADALRVAAAMPQRIAAVVSRGGRPDLAGDTALARVKAPTLLIVGGEDSGVIELNEQARRLLASCTHELVLVPGATHLFEEPGALEHVAVLAAQWFARHLNHHEEVPARRRHPA